jgi:F-type H+-transporting ATPase subunit a
MAADQQLTPTSYIGHHLGFQQVPLGDSPFWVLHVDTLITSVVLGVVAFGLMWLVVRGATAGVPGKRQAFVELLVNFIDDQVKGVFRAAS